MRYPEVFSKLNYETAVITFLKKNGEVRIMLGTRNLNTISLIHGFQGQVLGGHDNRCNINNGNLAVYDMVIGDARCFHIDRLLDIQYAGIITTEEEYHKVLDGFVKYKEEYEKSKPMMIDMDSFDNGGN